MEIPIIVYSARAYMITEDQNGISIYEEAIFSCLDEAMEFLKEYYSDKVKKDYYVRFRAEITEFELGNSDSFNKKWLYDAYCALLQCHTDEKFLPEKPYCKKFRVGDMVSIASKIQKRHSPSALGDSGVVAEITHKDPGSEGYNPDDTNNDYVVYFITAYGLLDHYHVSEDVISKCDLPVPTKYIFLELLSNYLKNGTYLSDELVKRLFDDDVFLLNIQRFDFEKQFIRPDCQNSLL